MPVCLGLISSSQLFTRCMPFVISIMYTGLPLMSSFSASYCIKWLATTVWQQ